MKPRHAVRIIAATLVAASAIAVACGGDDDDKSDAPTAAATTAATKPASAEPTAASTARTDVDELEVTAADFSFTLSLTSVRPGLPGVDVSFKNEGALVHQIAFYEDAEYTKQVAESQPVAGGGSSGFPFIAPAGATKLFYRCEIHKTQMTGELAVQ